jgi:hypothetical protein
MKNISQIRDKIKYPETLLPNFSGVKENMTLLIKTIWICNYYFLKYNNDKLTYKKDLITYMINIFNHFSSGIPYVFIKPEIRQTLLQSYLYFELNNTKYDLKSNINTDKVQLDKYVKRDTEYEEYRKLCKIIIEDKYKDKIIKDPSSLKNFLKPQYMIKTDNKEYLIFINQMSDTFNISLTPTGIIRARQNLCRLMKLSFVELDYTEMKALKQDQTFEKIITDYLEMKILV